MLIHMYKHTCVMYNIFATNAASFVVTYVLDNIYEITWNGENDALGKFLICELLWRVNKLKIPYVGGTCGEYMNKF